MLETPLINVGGGLGGNTRGASGFSFNNANASIMSNQAAGGAKA